ncbi:TPA: nucleoside triphosphate pyrophosphohydrolase family protein [Listeria monocytogenes]|nr:nucleotide pyrophosphohydrolase [Listeria monocytogenes]EAE6968539.1 nucleotide pyrophosphohydrolase [Listeria monocytogenes]EAE9329600.1 nucleotide pyrophosphohydrolase [Listeria monocytogenes]EAE9799441.1 nucleotide pyrophosphohydrolase [Listeria monocytogenes]EAF2349090.1 nucleotide pyrophosphohydrolase [Listeria monocytogenes]
MKGGDSVNNEMTLNEYQRKSMRTNIAHGEGDTMGLLNYALGTAGEAGEVADIIKKHAFHGHELNRQDLISELGDVMWYVSQLAVILGISLEEIAKNNVTKLEARYPNGFSEKDSINRKEDA